MGTEGVLWFFKKAPSPNACIIPQCSGLSRTTDWRSKRLPWIIFRELVGQAPTRKEDFVGSLWVLCLPSTVPSWHCFVKNSPGLAGFMVLSMALSPSPCPNTHASQQPSVSQPAQGTATPAGWDWEGRDGEPRRGEDFVTRFPPWNTFNLRRR